MPGKLIRRHQHEIMWKRPQKIKIRERSQRFPMWVGWAAARTEIQTQRKGWRSQVIYKDLKFNFSLLVNETSSSKRTTGEALKVFMLDLLNSVLFLELATVLSSPSSHELIGRMFALQRILVSPSSVTCSSPSLSLSWDREGVKWCPEGRGLRSVTWSGGTYQIENQKNY